MSKVRMYAGRHPENPKPVVPPIHDDEGREWLLYHLPAPYPLGWQNYKLCVVGCAPHKGNYSLGWSPIKRRIADSKDSYALDKHRPELYDGVWAYFDLCM